MGHDHIYGITCQAFLLFSLFVTQIQLGCSKQLAYSNISMKCIENERNALLKFREGLIDPSIRLSSWAGDECCKWKGVGCDKLTRNVVKLDLLDTLLEGDEISTSLLDLKHLEYLDLSGNMFSGIQIPTFLGSFKHLRYLNLSNAGFHGKIPSHLGNLSSLEHLDLSYSNGLSANSLWWITQLSSLKSLDLSLANLSNAKDWLEAIIKLPSLSSIKLRICGLHNISPLSQYTNFTTSNIASLDLSGNLINSTFPLWFFNLSSLVDLRLGFNKFRSQLPNTFQHLTSLTHLDLSYNYGFNTSVFPNSICTLTNLVHLDLRFNEFQCQLPLCLGNLTSLALLYLSHNSFQGTIPSGIGNLEKLRDLDISYNSLIGMLSEPHFAKLSQLEFLYINSNLLTLSVSLNWVPPFQLREINMDSIQTGPRFPSWLQTQKNVEKLSVSNAGIIDRIPDWFEIVYSGVYDLDLSGNQISGKPPNFKEAKRSFKEPEDLGRWITLDSNKFEGSLKSFPRDIDFFRLSNNFLGGDLPLPDQGNVTFPSLLRYIIVNNNNLSGNFPNQICNFRGLLHIDLSSNQLSGKIPSCLGNLQNLVVLNLAYNSFSGRIPSSFGNLLGLFYLQLNGNKFNGNLPSSLQNLTHLVILDVGENQLEGSIPTWISGISDLAFLRLQSNEFHGDVPVDLCELSSLQVLNLARNRLAGPIPSCFRNFSAMMSNQSDLPLTLFMISLFYPVFFNPMKGRELQFSSNLRYLRSIVLSENNLSGEIPIEILDLTGLQNLNLSKNNLQGRIPGKIGDLKHLESLDLSMNELSGSIPPSLGTISSLAYLNLSFNMLSGRIPQGNQLQTLVDPSIYKGNIGLCGKPLDKCPGDKSLKGNNNGSSSVDGNYKGKVGEKSNFRTWFYAGIGPGFAIGLLGVFCILLFNKSWRSAYFQAVDEVCNKVYAFIALKSLKRS